MILFLAGGALPALSDDAALGQGLVPPSPEALAWERTHMIRAGKIKLNRIGLERVNASRVSNGLSSLSDSQEVAPIGLEVEGSTDEELERLGAPVSLAEGLADLPSAVDNSALKYFPPIRSQGSIGSCAQWTAMYYCFTHMNALVRDLDAKNGTDAVRFSPKFTYNLVNGGVDSGSWPTEGWAIAAQHGAASWQDWPNDSNYRAWPKTAAVWRNALNVRVQTTGSISQCDTPTGMAQLKTLLVNGYVLSYATYISNWQYKTISDDPSTTEDDAHVGKTACYWVNGTTGGHGMTVVGYNDHIWVDINGNGSVDSGEKGAFRIANSWGSGWKDGGFTWIAYDALKRTSGVSGGPSANRTPAWWVGQAMWVTAKPIFNPKALAEITLNHVKRNQIGVSFGLSGTTETVPSTQWFPTGVLRYSGGAYSFSGNATPEDGTFVFDLSDLPAPYGIQKRWYLRVQDNAAGDPSFVKAFKWTNFSDSGQVVKSALPVDLDNAFQFFYVDATLTTGANNTPPTISSVSPVSTDEDTATAPLTFSVGDGETPVSSIAVAGTSNNLSLLPNTNIVFSGSGANRSVVLTPAPDTFGSATITLQVTDGGGLTAQTSFTLTVNGVNDRPTASPQFLATKLNTAKNILLAATDVDSPSLTFIALSPSHGTLTGTAPNMIYTPPVGYTGSSTFTFTASDGLLTSVPASITIQIDTAAPTVLITHPAGGQSVSYSIDVRATALDTVGVQSVVFFVDGTASSTDTIAPYSFNWNSQSVSNGVHVLTARAYDLAGNNTLSLPVSVTVSNAATPQLQVSLSSITFIGGTDGTPIPPRPVTVSDAAGQQSGFFWSVIWNGNWLTASPTSGTGSGIFSVGVDNSGLSTGTYRGSVTVMPWSSEGEETGNGSLVIPVTLMILDNTEKIPPTTPSGLTAAVSGPAQILLSWAPSTDTGGSGLAGYRLFRDGSFVAQPTATNYTDTGLTVGIEYTYAVLAVDHAENQSGLSETVRVTLSPDLPPTEVEAFSYPEPARAGVSPVIRVLMGDVNGVEITIYDTGGTVVHTARMESPNVAVDGKAGYEYAWAGPIASGVYYAAIHGQTLTGPVRAKTKITVIR